MSNFQGVSGGVGYSDTASDADSRRRNQLAQLMLQQSSATPAVGWTGALNKILSGAVAGWQMGKDSEEQKARGEAKNATLAQALAAGHGQAAETRAYGDGTTINWDEKKADPQAMAAILAGNRDTAPMGMQMQFGQIEADRKSQADIAAALRANQQARDQAMFEHDLAIQRDDRKGYDIGGGRRFFPDASGGAQPPQTAPTAPTVETAQVTPVETSPAQQPFNRTPGYATSVTGVENATGNPAARNPNSSAMGDGQFISATWLDLVKRNRPDLVQGKSDQDILALRADPKLSAEMIDVYGMENADALRAGGIQNIGNAEKYAAHFFGPQGAIKVLKADPSASFASILSPEAIKANPQLAKMTVGQWREKNAAKFGGGEQPQTAAVQPPATQPPGTPGRERTTVGGRSGTVVGGDGVRTLNADEVAQAGLPQGTVAQVDPAGKISVVSAAPKAGEGSSKGEREWRQDFQKPIAQARDLTSQVGIIRNAAKAANGTGDIAAIVAFNKLLDPGAVVREADVALTLQAQGVGDRLKTWMENKKEGDILPPELRSKMAELAETVYGTSNSYLRDSVMPYREVIEGDGLSFDKVLPPQMRKSMGWDDQPDPNAWQQVEIPADLTVAGRQQQQTKPAAGPATVLKFDAQGNIIQ